MFIYHSNTNGSQLSQIDIHIFIGLRWTLFVYLLDQINIFKFE